MLLRAGGGGDPAPGRNRRPRGPTGLRTQPTAHKILLLPPRNLRLIRNSERKKPTKNTFGIVSIFIK